MARPRSDDKRNAIMAAATRIIAAQGLGAPTALIAKAAGVSNGSLFTYFETKADLLNQLYIELKSEIASLALADMPMEQSPREQLFHVWSCSLRWAQSYPEKRRAMMQLNVSDEVGAASRDRVRCAYGEITALVERARENGPMHAAPFGLFAALMHAVADATVDFINQDPANADAHRQTGFDALWRMIG
ncbi:TetR/AcrR family transcriptional regulator [Sphingomonas sp. H39-1-10]|uniref:TetR/AcrR family transcriptional regulator n=1 Tax=Sphingomonas TaxID=13687 RepID=UPI0008876C24|nr:MULTISPECIES: TetR/AcrR family transcriptional regulator [Sphingomonas]MDF0487561.1 TetR/AcrR family transcriptional regulator [Sphingomonas pollutisoli]SDA16619.1 transcriptional regulator, TetR family [Sphingomonas sp. NFR15]